MRIAFPHKPLKHGGPGSFQMRLENSLAKKGWKIQYLDEQCNPDVILVVGGTRKLASLIKFKLKGVPIIYRLDGINWLHKKMNVSVHKWYVNELRNIINQIIRSFIASAIIYQSKFVAEWWQKCGWKTNADSTIIYNGVGLEEFAPAKGLKYPLSILCVEGNLDYSPYAVKLLNGLQKNLIEQSGFDSLILYGGFENEENEGRLDKNIDYRGRVSRSELPFIYRNCVYLSLDVNAACPNTVIEAMASGLPVIGFDTGALKELVPDGAGEVVPYGGNPWEIEFPDLKALCDAALKVNRNWPEYAEKARIVAENRYNHLDVADKYIAIIEDKVGNLY